MLSGLKIDASLVPSPKWWQEPDPADAASTNASLAATSLPAAASPDDTVTNMGD
jgi:hypothetical protein